MEGGPGIIVWAVNLETKIAIIYSNFIEALSDLKMNKVLNTEIDQFQLIINKNGYYFLDNGRQFYSDKLNSNFIFISNKLLLTLIPSLGDNNEDTSTFNLSNEQFKLITDIEKIGHRKKVYVYDTKFNVILNNSKPFDSATSAGKEIGCNYHSILNVLNSGKLIKNRYLVGKDISNFNMCPIN